MSLENVYYIGQTIAVGAILFSLIAIWMQMKQSARMERAAAQREILDRVSEWTNSLAPEQFDQFLLGLSDFDAVPYESAVITEVHCYRWAFVTESALNMHKEGYFSDGTWAGIEGVMIGLLRTPGGKRWWDYAQGVLGFEVVDYLNGKLQTVPNDAPNYLDFSPRTRARIDQLKNQASPIEKTPAEE